MGETLRMESERFEAHHDPVHLAAMRERTLTIALDDLRIRVYRQL